MNQIEKEFLHSILSVASYVNFKEGLNSQEEIKRVLAGHTDWADEKEKTNFFIENFEVAYHQPDTSSGFSATVFKVKGTDFDNSSASQYVLATRGTAGLIDIVDADINGIVRFGVPKNQVVDLHNLIKRLSSSPGQPYNFAIRDTLPLPALLGFGIASKDKISFEVRTDGLGYSNWFTQGINATGHSLGGNLAASFGRLFPDFTNTNEYYGYNSAGVAGPLSFVYLNPGAIFETRENEFYSELNAASTYENFAFAGNVFADDGLEVVTSDVFFAQVGKRVPVNIEYGFAGSD